MPITKKSAPTASDYQAPEGFVDEDAEDTAAPAADIVLNSGWGAAQKLAEESRASGKHTTEFKVTEDEQLISFLPGDVPLDSYRQHWINRTKGKRSFVCIGASCPLCKKLGDSPSAKYAFAVAAFNIPDNDDPVTVEPKLLVCGKGLMDLLFKLDQDSRKGPLSGNFYSISRSGTGTSTTYSVSYVKDRDLSEDWGMDPQDARAEIGAMSSKDVHPVYRSDIKELSDVAQEVLSH